METVYCVEIHPSLCQGKIHLPASKSLSHRALICAGLAAGESLLQGLSRSQDITATKNCLKALGARFEEQPDGLHVWGTSLARVNQPVILDAHESGSTLRFFIPIAATGHEPVTFLGKPSLLSRPMGIYASLFARQNLPFVQQDGQITFHGPLQPGLFEIPGDISSQFISGLLFAAPLLGRSILAVLPPYESRSYVALTVEMMEKFGIQIQQPTSSAYEVAGGQSYQPRSITIEGDYSQLAFFAVLGALQSKITCTNISPNSLQGDRVILDILKQAGADICWDSPEEVTISKGILSPSTQPFVIDLANCPDLGPILCVLGAYLPGTTRIENAARLRYKESDRIAVMEEELRKWGVNITSDQNSITIHGKETYQADQPILIDPHNDHRIAMAMSIFALCTKSPSIIENAQVVNKSYPAFFEDLASLQASISIQS